MCGRFAFYCAREAVTRPLGVADAPAVEPRALAMLLWVLVPFSANERAIGARLPASRPGR